MKKKLPGFILLIVTIFNLYISQPAFSFIYKNKHNTVSISSHLNILSSGKISDNDTTKIIIRKSGSMAPEKPFNYSNNTLSNNVSFDLKPIAKRKFSVSFLNKNNAQIAVKIYDVIGNLIIEENVSGKGYFYKEYDLSFYNTDLFIIEVGNSKYNKTKSLVAG